MNKPMQQIGRLAMREEGDNWNAYYALPDTMDEAIFLGSIRMGAIVSNADRKNAFMAMMRDVVADIIQEKTGVRPIWNSARPAPEHEKAGHS